MNIRFITILSSIALVSVALSSGTTIPGSSTVGGSTSTPKQSSTSVSSSFTMSAITTANPPPSVSSTSIPTIIANTTIVTVKRTSSTSPVTSKSLINNTSNSSKTIPPQSINSNAVTTNTNSTTPSTAANTKTNNSTQQPAGPRTTLNPVPSIPAKTTVPDTTTEETIETTVQCDCSKYLPTSTDSANKNTEPTTTPTSSQTTVEPQTSVAPQTTLEPQTNEAPQTTVAPQITMTPQTTAAPLMSLTANTPSKTTTNTTTEKTTTPITMTKHITTKNTTTTSTTNSSIVIKTVPTTLPPTTMVSAITTVSITGASITSKPATPQPTAAPPTTAPHKTAQPKTSQPKTSQPTTPPPTTAPPSTAPPTTAPPITPQPNTSQPKTSQPTTPPSTTAPHTTPIHTTKTIPELTTTMIATTNLTKSTIIQKPVTNGPAAPPSNAKRYRRDVDMIQHDDEGLVDDDTNTHDINCMEVCNITMNETTTVPKLTTTTEIPTTTTPRHRSIDLSGKSVVLQLVIVVNDTFTSCLDNKSSSAYRTLANQYETALTAFYRDLLLLKFKKIDILGFSDGSINCNYSLETTAPTNESEANSTVKELRDVKWKKDSLMNLTIDVNKTIAVQKVLLENDNCVLPINVCAHHEVLDWDKNGNPECKYKCDIPENKVYCGAHGECSYTYEGSIRCICKDGYSGELCKIPKPTTTTAKPIKPDTIALSKIDIIGIAGGIGGGLVLILLVALCCVYTKLNKAKKRDRFYGYMDNDKEFLHDENSRIENVPDLKNEYTNLGYQTEQDELQMQRFEPEGKNVDYEPGQRQGAYERDDKAYRKVEEPEGGNVLIYQPKHLNGPMERQSGASKFDEVEERSNPYRMMDTDTTYKIRRPTVNSDRNVPYN